MTTSGEIDDAYAERLLRTRGLAAGSRDDAAALFIAAVAGLGNDAPSPTGALARLLEEGFVPLPAPAPSPAPARSRPEWWPSRTLVAAALSGTVFVGLATGASAGVLPGGLQDRVAGLLEATTPFEFPRSEEPVKTQPDQPGAPVDDEWELVPSAPAAPGTGVTPGGPTPSPLPTPVPGLVGEPDPAAPSLPQQVPSVDTTPGNGMRPEVDPPRRENPGTPGATPGATPGPAQNRPSPGPREDSPPGFGFFGPQQQTVQGNDQKLLPGDVRGGARP